MFKQKLLKTTSLPLVFALICEPSVTFAGNYGWLEALRDRFKTTLGLNHTRENMCMALLETSVEFNKVDQSSQLYAKHAFQAFAGSLHATDVAPQLENGYAVVERGDVVSGSMSTGQVAQRMAAIQRLKNEGAKAEGQEMKTLAFSTASSEDAQKLIQYLDQRLDEAKQSQIRMAPAQLFFAEIPLLGLAVAVVLPQLDQSAVSSTLASLNLLLAILNAGHFKKAVPGYNTAPNHSADLERILQAPKSPNRTFFLISQSVQVSQRLLSHVLGQIESSETQMTSQERQYEILLERTYINALYRRLNRFVLNRRFTEPVWVHTDFLIELDPDGTQQVHMLSQFTQKAPQFPVKKKEEQGLQIPELLGVPRPVLVPVPAPAPRPGPRNQGLNR